MGQHVRDDCMMRYNTQILFTIGGFDSEGLFYAKKDYLKLLAINNYTFRASQVPDQVTFFHEFNLTNDNGYEWKVILLTVPEMIVLGISDPNGEISCGIDYRGKQFNTTNSELSDIQNFQGFFNGSINSFSYSANTRRLSYSINDGTVGVIHTIDSSDFLFPALSFYGDISLELIIL
jgi:hypothetical protein